MRRCYSLVLFKLTINRLDKKPNKFGSLKASNRSVNYADGVINFHFANAETVTTSCITRETNKVDVMCDVKSTFGYTSTTLLRIRTSHKFRAMTSPTQSVVFSYDVVGERVFK
jgi:hypothetical protein